MKANQQVRRGRVKVIAAVIGGSAVVAMGALSVALHEEQAPGASGGVATGATFIQGSMTMGQTATTTTPPAAPVTSIATPPMTATTPAGFR
ncbi:MAG: hypothetical protein QOF31_4288 [Mycobacterium sp.]|jgi:outer membrane biosynthesis protein TonB|nr:hypothetical protein [Mycobacterium sp.]